MTAEELIADIYAQIHAAREEHRSPRAVVLSPEDYRTIQAFRARLGDVPDGMPDYLGKYELFGLPILTETGSETRIVVE